MSINRLLNIFFCFLILSPSLTAQNYSYGSPTWERITTPADRFDEIAAVPSGFLGISNNQLYYASDNSTNWVVRENVETYWMHNNGIVNTEIVKSYSTGSSPIQYTLLYEEIDLNGNQIKTFTVPPNNSFTPSDMPPRFYLGNGLVAFMYTWNNADHVRMIANGITAQISHDDYYHLSENYGQYLGKYEGQHLWQKGDTITFYQSLLENMNQAIGLPFSGSVVLLNSKCFIYNNQEKRIARLNGTNWEENNFPNNVAGELIINGGRFYFKGDQLTNEIDNNNFALGAAIGENAVLEEAEAWTGNKIFRVGDCQQYLASENQGLDFQPIDINAIQMDIEAIDVIEEGYLIGKAGCVVSVGCVEEAIESTNNFSGQFLDPEFTVYHQDKIMHYENGVIYRSLDAGVSFDSIRTYFVSGYGYEAGLDAKNDLVVLHGQSPIATTDFGDTWVDLDLPVRDVETTEDCLLVILDGNLVCMAEDLQTELINEGNYSFIDSKDSIYLLGNNKGHMIRSEDFGLNWATSTNFSTLKNIEYFTSDELVINVSYDAAEGARAAISKDLGKNWLILASSPFQHNIPFTWLNLPIGHSTGAKGSWSEPGDGYLYALGLHKGLWRIGLADIFLEEGLANINFSICAGGTVEIEGQLYEEEGIYPIAITSNQGCDSTYTIGLTISPTFENVFEQTINAGDSILGIPIFQDTVLTESLLSIHNCDSINIYNIAVDSIMNPVTPSLERNSVLFSPNPTTSKVNLKIIGNAAISQLHIFDVHGNLLFARPGNKTNLKSIQADLSPFPGQLFFIQTILTDGSIVTRKIIKQ